MNISDYTGYYNFPVKAPAKADGLLYNDNVDAMRKLINAHFPTMSIKTRDDGTIEIIGATVEQEAKLLERLKAEGLVV